MPPSTMRKKFAQWHPSIDGSIHWPCNYLIRGRKKMKVHLGHCSIHFPWTLKCTLYWIVLFDMQLTFAYRVLIYLISGSNLHMHVQLNSVNGYIIDRRIIYLCIYFISSIPFFWPSIHPRTRERKIYVLEDPCIRKKKNTKHDAEKYVFLGKKCKHVKLLNCINFLLHVVTKEVLLLWPFLRLNL